MSKVRVEWQLASPKFATLWNDYKKYLPNLCLISPCFLISNVAKSSKIFVPLSMRPLICVSGSSICGTSSRGGRSSSSDLCVGGILGLESGVVSTSPVSDSAAVGEAIGLRSNGLGFGLYRKAGH